MGSFVRDSVQEKNNNPEDLECQYDQFPVPDDDILAFREHHRILRSRQ